MLERSDSRPDREHQLDAHLRGDEAAQVLRLVTTPCAQYG